MHKLIVILNHNFSVAQEQDAEDNLKISEVLEMPLGLSETWSSIPSQSESLCHLLSPLKAWLKRVSSCGDYVLVQGDYGATYLLVKFSLKNGLVPVYATTERSVCEHLRLDGKVEIQRTFSHVRFRKYEE